MLHLQQSQNIARLAVECNLNPYFAWGYIMFLLDLAHTIGGVPACWMNVMGEM